MLNYTNVILAVASFSLLAAFTTSVVSVDLASKLAHLPLG